MNYHLGKRILRIILQWLIAPVLSIVLQTTNLVSQTPHRPIAIDRSDGNKVAARQTTIKKSGRFLGWKFAAQSRQDTRKWLRQPVKQQVLVPADSFPLSLARNYSLSSGTSGFENVGFDSRPSLPAGYLPTAVISGDFNEDGKLDFAVSNGGDNTIYVFFGNGDGTFKVPEVLYTEGQAPDWITAVRLRANGHLDLAVSNGDSNTVEIFPGNGDGTFQASTQVPVPQIPTFILAADANKDGNQDLVVGLTIAGSATQPQFCVLLGNGSGGFSGKIFSPAVDNEDEGPIPTGWIAAGDINNDGFVDFVTTVTGGGFVPYLNQGGKGFLLTNFLGYNDGPMVVGLADMDEDGCLDAVQFGTLGLVTIAKGSCDGNFDQNPNVTAMAGDLDPAIAFADVDGDGHLDVIGSAVYYPLADNPEAGREAGYLVSVLKGDGKGNLSTAAIYRGGSDAYSLVVGDFLGNGRPDILTTNSIENQLSLFSNDGTGKYGVPQGETIGYPDGIGPVNTPDNQSPMEVADLNGDGKPDLLLVEYGPIGGGPPQLTSILNDGTGAFLSPVRTPIPIGESIPIPAFISGTFRGGTTPDVIYINTYDGVNSVFNVAYFAGNGDGTFKTPVVLTTVPNPQKLVGGDFNNDGKLDFAVLGTDGEGFNWQVDVFLGHGDGTFTHLAPQRFPILSSEITAVVSPQQLFAIDLNHDGKADLLIGLNGNGGWLDSGDDLLQLLGNGDGTFQAPTVLFYHFGAVAIADVNRDGFPDLIQNRDPSKEFQYLYIQSGITVYLGSANGAFYQQPSYDLPAINGPSFNPALVGDFNGDGIPDIAIRCWFARPFAFLIEPHLVILQGVGDGTFISTGHAYQLPAGSYPFVGADFNGDGASDLVELTGLTSSFHTITATSGAALDIAVDSSPLLGSTGTATVTLDLPAASTEDVVLSASDPSVHLPASLTFNAGQQSESFSFALNSSFDASHVLALYAKLGTQTAVAYTTKPNPNLVTGVSAGLWAPGLPDPLSSGSKVSIEPGENVQLTFGLASEGGYSGKFSSLACSGLPPGASCSFSTDSLLILPGGTEGLTVSISTSTSTPFGLHSVTVSSTDGVAKGQASFELGTGDFSFSINPKTIVVGPSGNAMPSITSSSTNGLNEPLQFACTGLPLNTECSPNIGLYTSGGTAGLGISYNQLAANDYPFQITGTADIISHTISAILRVGDFSASLDKTAATLSSGQSATFNLTLTSMNHYANTITVFCQPPSNKVTCSVSSSPANLTDDGTATLQLMVTAPANSAMGTRKKQSIRVVLLVSFIPFSLIICLRRTRPLLTLLATLSLAVLISCGGAGIGEAGNPSPPSPPPPPGPQTVSIPVIAQATMTSSDSSNQKNLSPIVITLN